MATSAPILASEYSGRALNLSFRSLVSDLRTDYGYTVEMVCSACGAKDGTELFDWGMTGKGLTVEHVMRLHNRRDRVRGERKRSKTRRVPSRRADRLKVESKRDAKDRKKALSESVLGDTTEEPTPSPDTPPPTPEQKEDSPVTTQAGSRPQEDSQHAVAALYFMMKAFAVSQSQMSRVMGDPLGRRVGNWLVRVRGGAFLSDETIGAVETIFRDKFNFDWSSLEDRDPNDYQYMQAGYAHVPGGYTRADGTNAKDGRKTGARKGRKKGRKDKNEARAAREAAAAAATNGVTVEAESPAPDVTPQTIPTVVPPAEQLAGLMHFDDKIERVRTLLVEATREVTECREVAPRFGGIKGQLQELETWLMGTVEQWWPDPDKTSEESTSDRT